MSRQDAAVRAQALARLGQRMFADVSLSASGRLACATCHRPDRAFGPPPGGALPLAGADGRQTGFRAVPSLEYLQDVPPFADHFFASEDDGDESVDNGPTGGLTWDGRVDRVRDQALIPLLSPFEMANASAADIVLRARRAGYGAELAALGGSDRDPDVRALAGMRDSIEAYLETPAVFDPYTSKYDAVLAGRADLTPAERRGRALFEDPSKGNCARCHPSERAGNGLPPVFTDFGYAAIGVPANPVLIARGVPAGHDLGLCGPLRTDHQDQPDDCGLFRVPSLRNVALRDAFFHDGAVHTLRDAVSFYATRDTDLFRWYGRHEADAVGPLDDLSQRFRDNLDRDLPFGGRPGGRPSLTPDEIDDIVSFLETLRDGFEPARAATSTRR